MRARWLSLLDVMVIIVLMMIASYFVFISFGSLSHQGFSQLARKDYEKAEQIWQKKLGQDAFSHINRLNLAFTYHIWNKPERAIQEYGLARRLFKAERLKGERQDMDYQALFNSAVSATKKKDLNQALDFYQQALALKKDDLKTKTNIELLVKNQRVQKSAKDKDKKNKKDNQKKQKNNENKKQNSSEQDKKNQPEDEQKSKKDQDNKKEGGEKKDPEQTEKDKKPDENKNSNADQNDTDEQDAQKKNQGQQFENKEYNFSKPEKRPHNKLNRQQTDAILKAILEQEKNIRERRQKSGRRRQVKEKDW